MQVVEEELLDILWYGPRLRPTLPLALVGPVTLVGKEQFHDCHQRSSCQCADCWCSQVPLFAHPYYRQALRVGQDPVDAARDGVSLLLRLLDRFRSGQANELLQFLERS